MPKGAIIYQYCLDINVKNLDSYAGFPNGALYGFRVGDDYYVSKETLSSGGHIFKGYFKVVNKKYTDSKYPVSRQEKGTKDIVFLHYTAPTSQPHTVQFVRLAEFDFTENPIQEVGSEKRLHIDGAVTLDGQLRVTVRGDGTLPGTVTVGIMPQVSIDEMKLGEITGKVNVDIEEVNEEVDLGDIPDFLKDKDVVLDIEHPVIMLEVGNTTGVPVLADLTLTPLADGSPIENGIIELRREERDIVVKAADEMGEYTWSNFFISNSEAGMELGFEFVDVPNLPNLIRQIPDVIQINMTAEADPEAEHRFDLSHGDYEMNVRYNVHVPLTFGPDLQVIYRDTIDDFNSDIKDYVKYVTEVVMEMEVENTIPLGMMCRAVALDVDGRALSGIEVSTPQPIEAAGWDGNNTTLVRGDFTIELKETVAGTMEQLDGLALEITADANEGVEGASLKNNQYLRLSGKMRIPGGITVDIDDI